MKRKIITLGIALHFFFILSVVTHLHDHLGRRPLLLPITLPTDYYSAITFTNRNFGFFAPSVTSDWNIQMTTTDTSGRKQQYTFNLPNREMKVKMYSMLGHFAESEDSMDLFARSWALKAMNENGDVTQVDVEITQNYIPTMKEYREGRRVEPQLFYRTTFDQR
jgi:hypothetical protein